MEGEGREGPSGASDGLTEEHDYREEPLSSCFHHGEQTAADADNDGDA